MENPNLRTIWLAKERIQDWVARTALFNKVFENMEYGQILNLKKATLQFLNLRISLINIKRPQIDQQVKKCKTQKQNPKSWRRFIKGYSH